MTAEEERAAIVAWLRRDVAAEATRMILVAGMPGGTKTDRVKNRAYAAGCAHGVKCVIDAIERAAHLSQEQSR